MKKQFPLYITFMAVVLLSSCTIRPRIITPVHIEHAGVWSKINLNPYVCCDPRWISDDGQWEIAPAGPPWLRNTCGYGAEFDGSRWVLQRHVQNDSRMVTVAYGTLDEMKARAAIR